MVLDRHRNVLDWWLVPLARASRSIHPDVFTWLALVCALGAGLSFWYSSPERLGWLGVAFVFVGLNSIFDLLDGKIAHMTGQATPRGDFLDHAVDRFSDAAILTGVALSAWSGPAIGIIAVAGTLLTSYMGTQAQAVGLKRNYGGILGRADRMVLLLIMPLATILWEVKGYPQPWQPWAPSLLDLMMVYFAVLGVFTTLQRFAVIFFSFARSGQLRR